MGICIQEYRCRIGSFVQPVKTRHHMRTLNLCKIPMCIRLLIFLLLVVQGVEANPGPTGATGRGAPSGRGSNADHNRRLSNSGKGGSQRGTDRGRQSLGRGGYGSSIPGERINPTQPVRSSQRISQRNINDWLDPSQPEERVDQYSPFDTESVPTDETLNTLSGTTLDDNLENPNIQSVILDIHRKVNGLDRKFDKVQKDIDSLKKSNEELKRENKGLNETMVKLTENVLRLEEKVDSTERRNENLEAQSRRENLLFMGFNQQGNESWADSEEKVRKYMTDHLSIDESKVSIERAHRLRGRTGAPPIIVKFSHFKDKDKVLQSYRDKKKACRADGVTGDNAVSDTLNREHQAVRVTEDFTTRVRNIRSRLVPFIDTFRSQNRRVFLRYDKLVVDGIPHSFDFSTDDLVPDA